MNWPTTHWSAGAPARRERYADRAAAGRALAEALRGLAQGDEIVAGIPRGGAVVAAAVGERLERPVTLAFVRKITLARAPEVAVGAVDEDAATLLDGALVGLLHGGPHETARAQERARAEIARQQRVFVVPPLSRLARDASVVLVDDGLATGATMRAAVRFVRRHGARRILVAAPCASADIAHDLEGEVERLVCPWVDADFGAVGAYYVNFKPVSDAEVLAALARAQPARAGEWQEGRP